MTLRLQADSYSLQKRRPVIYPSYVLVGDPSAKERFVEGIIRNENIPGYNIFRYDEDLKIEDVRQIKKNLSLGAMSGTKRLFLIRNATLAAQNALLKTLEELPDDTIFIFLNDSELIPTILSRCRIKNLMRTKMADNNEILIIFREFANKILLGSSEKRNIASTLLFVDRLFTKYPELNLSEIVLVLRTILLEKIRNQDFKGAAVVLEIIKKCNQSMQLVTVNNLNRRLLFEKILISKT